MDLYKRIVLIIYDKDLIRLRTPNFKTLIISNQLVVMKNSFKTRIFNLI